MLKLKHFIISIICFFSFINVGNAITNIEINNASLIPNFKKEIKTYNVFVDKNIEEVTIKCNKEDEETVKNEGIIHLREGINEIELSVIKNNEIIDSYTLNITRGEVEKDLDSAELKRLEVEGYSINFDKDRLNYEINIESFINDLTVNYEAVNINANVKLTGSSNLNNSENIIEIKVTSVSENNSKIYRIKVNKVLPTFKEEKNNDNVFGDYSLTKKEKIIIIVIISTISLLIILITYIILFKRKPNKK